LLLAALLVLGGCEDVTGLTGSFNGSTELGTPDIAFEGVETEDPTRPPMLQVSTVNGEVASAMNVTAAGYSWCYANGDGTQTYAITDRIHPLQGKYAALQCDARGTVTLKTVGGRIGQTVRMTRWEEGKSMSARTFEEICLGQPFSLEMESGKTYVFEVEVDFGSDCSAAYAFALHAE
jgi:hypothetical protein